MPSSVKHATVVILMDDGKTVQRPMNAVETDIVCAMLATHDNGVLKVIPAKGIEFKSSGEILKGA